MPPATEVRDDAGSESVADMVTAALSGGTQSRKRQRVHYSCSECHRRKHKSCIDRGIGELCHPYGDGDHLGSLSDRVRRLENLLNALAKSHGALEQRVAKLGQRDAAELTAGDVRESEAANDAGSPLYQPSAYGMEREELLMAEKRHNGISDDSRPTPKASDPLGGGLAKGGVAWFGALALPSVSQQSFDTEVDGEKFQVGSDIPLSAASVHISTLIAEGGAQKTVLYDLFSQLPPRQLVERLICIFFKDINNYRYFMHEPTFRINLNEMYEYIESPLMTKTSLEGARFVPFLATTFMLLAVTHSAMPESECSERDAQAGAMRLFHAGRKCIQVGKCIRNEHIDLVLAQVLASCFCLLFRRTSDAWTYIGAAVRDSQAMGFHRDGSKLGLDARTTERRRRLWAIVYYHDRQASILMSRPSSIQEKHCDTALPSDVDLEDVSPRERATIPRFVAKEKPGVYAYVYFRQILAQLMGDTLELFQDVTRTVRYSDILAMDKRLAEFHDQLPAYFREPSDPAGSREFDAECSYLPIQRYLLLIEYNFVRITLHRPYILRNDSRFINSRNIAFQVAMNDRLVRKEFSESVHWPPTVARSFHIGGLYRLFNTTLVFGIMALIEKDPVRAAEARGFLEEFMEKHKNRTDLCSCRELQIVGLFLAKAQSPRTTLCKHQIRTRNPRQTDEQVVPNLQSDDTSTPGEVDTAQSLLNHLGGFGHSTQFGVPNMVLDPHSNMQDARFPYGPMPLSFDINRLDLNRINSFVSTGDTPDTSFVSTPTMTNMAPFDGSQMPQMGGIPMNGYAAGAGMTANAFAPSGVPLNADPVQSGMIGSLPSTGAPTQDLLLTPWSGLIDAIVSPFN
ncbi:hypothetical protein MCUN1_002643 [Malassezia cuniculi]|uniref:Xylanolytic transcriptional activator regulatory domain-containing protein n=1 Tax=Malassezia cuniculi TaxID=948313 RepID=A0AAF0ES83_9BASI|nr:hypothetical protein MCUN1_002643 [Malassezia cuniculi]